ncbi:MAG TPA: hypothetical protein VNK41_12695 [Vicinamibacterales bacterium]|nr:hypothetical protein [Vicinamibacterales bacterium]
MRPRTVLALVAALLATAVPSAQTIDRVMAVVGGRIVTLSDVRAARELNLVAPGTAAGGTREIVDRLVDRILMLEEVERYAPPEPDAAAVDARLEAIEAGFTSREAFERALRVSGMSEAGLRQWVRSDLRIAAYLDQRFGTVIEPTGTELENYARQIRSELEARGAGVGDEEQLRRLARERAIAERRQALIKDWLEGLRRRTAVTYTQQPG